LTHTLHRFDSWVAAREGVASGAPGAAAPPVEEYVVFAMAAQKHNDAGAAPKLAAILRILASHGPVNVGDDNHGGVFTGWTVDDLCAAANDKAYMAAVYAGRDQAVAALTELRTADLGMPVVVTGDRGKVLSVLEEAGLTPHTYHISLGVFGDLSKLAEPGVLDVVSMCGHGMVCPAHVRHVVREVGRGKMTASEAATDLARPCTCAMFNPTRAAAIVDQLCGSDGGGEPR
jgi:hypothetical protein